VSGEDVLLRERSGRVVIATLNRPAKGNALNHALIDSLDALAGELDNDPRTGALVLTGAGAKAFSAGADVSELDGLDRAAAREQMRRGQAVFDRLEQLPIAVIAAINGFALGGGLELAMAADVRLVVGSARLGQPEITLANLPGWGGTQRLPRLVGRGVANEMILSGDLIDAERAYAIGLVNDVVADPLAASMELAARIADHSPVAVRGAKHAIAVGLRDGAEAGLIAEADAVAECCTTDEQHAAVRAFLDRRAR
jgi:enoyl-CoA hydratase